MAIDGKRLLLIIIHMTITTMMLCSPINGIGIMI